MEVLPRYVVGHQSSGGGQVCVCVCVVYASVRIPVNHQE
jgi:hypothetical protein